MRVTTRYLAPTSGTLFAAMCAMRLSRVPEQRRRTFPTLSAPPWSSICVSVANGVFRFRTAQLQSAGNACCSREAICYLRPSRQRSPRPKPRCPYMKTNTSLVCGHGLDMAGAASKANAAICSKNSAAPAPHLIGITQVKLAGGCTIARRIAFVVSLAYAPERRNAVRHNAICR